MAVRLSPCNRQKQRSFVVYIHSYYNPCLHRMCRMKQTPSIYFDCASVRRKPECQHVNFLKIRCENKTKRILHEMIQQFSFHCIKFSVRKKNSMKKKTIRNKNLRCYASNKIKKGITSTARANRFNFC